MAADEAALSNVRIQKSYTTVLAPIDGRTGNITQKEGNIVTANNTELAVIHQVEPIYVTFAVPESRLSEIKGYFERGGKLPVITRPQDGTGASERGELSFIDNAVDTTTGTIRLKGTFQNSNHQLWPGQFVNVVLQLTTRRGAVVVPNQAVQTGQDGTFVYVVGDDRKVSFRPVKVGPRVDLDLVIDEGLKAGEIVVTEGQLRLQPGSEISSSDGSNNSKGGGRGEFKGGDGDSGGKSEFKDGFKGNGGIKGKGEFKGKSDFKSGGA
jgi:multidrug efflux system membrane fusion protein